MGTRFSITGVDDGIYRLTETKAPEGYNMIKEPFYFVVEAAHVFEGYIDDSKRAEILNLEAYQTKDEEHNFVKAETVVLEFSADKKEGTVSTDVVNTSGSTLPSTGGAGRVLIYVVGAILVLGAGVIIVMTIVGMLCVGGVNFNFFIRLGILGLCGISGEVRLRVPHVP